MATFDQLSAEQRAIIELVLKQGQSYDELGDMLGLPTSRVRSMAREALQRLSPVSAAAVDDGWRDQLADYLLNQQEGPEATATRGHLRRSEAARGWARSIEDSLDHLYENGNAPVIPEPEARGDGERAPRRRLRGGGESKAGTGTGAALSPEARSAVKRRRLIAGGALALVALLAVLVWPIGLLTGDDDDGGGGSENASAAGSRVVGQFVLRPQGAARQANAVGAGVVAEQGGALQMIVQAQLPPTKEGEAYEVWLYNSRGNARSLGAQVTNRQGVLQGRAELPRNFTSYRYIDISRERVDNNRGHSGNSVLRERISRIQAPQAAEQNQGQGGQGQGTTPQPDTTPQTTTP